MEEKAGGESWEARPRVRRCPKRGLPADHPAIRRENSAAAAAVAPESFSSPSSPRFNSLGAATFSLGQSQTLDGGSFHGSQVAAETDRAYPDYWSLIDEFQRQCSLRLSSLSDEYRLFSETAQTNCNGLDRSHHHLPMPVVDPSHKLDGKFLINNPSPISRLGGESLTRNPSTTTFSNSNGSSPDFLTDYYRGVANCGTHAAHGLSPAQELENMRGKMVRSAMEQEGSRDLQKLMDHLRSESEVELILSELLTRIGEVMVNDYGNYVVQKLIGLCSEDQITMILLVLSVEAQLFRVCLDINGTRVVQRLLNRVDPENSDQLLLVTRSLNPHVVQLVNSPNGHHAIVHCLQYFPEIYNEELLMTVACNCLEVAKNKSGCCVLQHCVEHARGKVKELLVIAIISNAVELSRHSFGNYVVQFILGLNMPNAVACLVLMLKGHFQALSSSKYGSNVVEKCLTECDGQQANGIIMELLEIPAVSTLLVDPYGNYVIQSALEVSKGQTRKALIDAIVLNSPSMRCNLYGKKILAWLEKRKLIRR